MSPVTIEFARAMAAVEGLPSGLMILGQFASAANMAPATFLDSVAREVGEGYLNEQIPYESAMGCIADIYNALFPSDLLFPATGKSLMYQVYWALDEGEYGVESDGEMDPTTTRVVPALRLALERPV